MRSLIVLSFLLLSANSFALETDNYFTWGMELKDATTQINEYVNNRIQETLNKINKRKKPMSCRRTTMKVAKRFATRPPVSHPLEDFLADNLSEEYVYPKKGVNYRSKSIYQIKFRFYLGFVHLAPNMQVNGYYFGTDKLSHFVSTGRRYYKHYNKKRKKGLSHEDAVKSAIVFGMKNEISFLGTWTSGVYSYGDMEANYQGLKFWLSLCGGDDPYLVKDEKGDWQFRKSFDVKKYVNPYWDESFNLSYRLPKNWAKTSKSIKKHVCPKFKDPAVKARLDYYKAANHNSFSLDYIRELQAAKKKYAPNPYLEQNVDELCRYENARRDFYEITGRPEERVDF